MCSWWIISNIIFLRIIRVNRLLVIVSIFYAPTNILSLMLTWKHSKIQFPLILPLNCIQQYWVSYIFIKHCFTYITNKNTFFYASKWRQSRILTANIVSVYSRWPVWNRIISFRTYSRWWNNKRLPLCIRHICIYIFSNYVTGEHNLYLCTTISNSEEYPPKD